MSFLRISPRRCKAELQRKAGLGSRLTWARTGLGPRPIRAKGWAGRNPGKSYQATPQVRLLIAGMAHIMALQTVLTTVPVQCGSADEESADGQDFPDRERQSRQCQCRPPHIAGA